MSVERRIEGSWLILLWELLDKSQDSVSRGDVDQEGEAAVHRRSSFRGFPCCSAGLLTEAVPPGHPGESPSTSIDEGS